MPKRKKLPEMPDYTALPKRSEQMLIQKSRPLMALSQTSLTLAEFKILDVYLSRINSHEPEKRLIRFEKGTLEQLLEVSRLNRNELIERLENLFVKIRLPDVNNPTKTRVISLFEIAEIEQDNDGYWQVDLACTQSAMKYIFNVENIGYLKYRLKNIIKLKSRYSYILYLYLMDNRHRSNWQIPIKQLRAMLNCSAASYDEFRMFNDKILKSSMKEINEKTDLVVEYTAAARVNRKFTKVEFTIITQKMQQAAAELETQTVIDTSAVPDTPIETDQHKYWADMFGGNDVLADLCEITRYEFTKADIEYLAAILQRVPEIDERKQILHETYMNMYRYAHRVKNRLNYLAAALRKEIKKHNAPEPEPESKPESESEQPHFDINKWYEMADLPVEVLFGEDAVKEPEEACEDLTRNAADVEQAAEEDGTIAHLFKYHCSEVPNTKFNNGITECFYSDENDTIDSIYIVRDVDVIRNLPNALANHISRSERTGYNGIAEFVKSHAAERIERIKYLTYEIPEVPERGVLHALLIQIYETT